jgi:excisionase family DNA binding protein
MEDMVTDNQMSNMLTVREVARLLNVHPNTLRRWSDVGRIRVYRITPRGDRRFRQQDLAHFLDELNAGKGNGSEAGSIQG